MPALKDPEENIATLMKVKKALIRKPAFLKPPHSRKPELKKEPGIAHLTVTEDIVAKVIVIQSATKIPGPNKINS